MSENKKRGASAYLLVFGILAAIIAAAALSTLLFNRTATTGLQGGNLSYYGRAPQIVGISSWINSPPLNITKLKGKVVLVDFWTYSCINCIRTIPFLNALNREYGGDGLVIIGVHTPEFQFEHNLTNVEAAVRRFNITYPVALDNNYGTWGAYNNQYWPADYLVDANGIIRYESFGEGPESFNGLQQAIRGLLEAANYPLPQQNVSLADQLNFTQPISPEMYLGYGEIQSGRSNYFGEALHPASAYNYTIPNAIQPDVIYLSGDWYSAQDSIIAEGNNSRLILVYRAKDLNVVASGNGGNSTIRILLNGTTPSQDRIGSNVRLYNGIATAGIGQSQLYNLINASSYGVSQIEINASTGFRIYTFTFG
ncbi:MAG: redoxin domain-containing protein [Candidatus Micrarchaeota archaeon]|nr:redoxin domain-containing protein [Candidatus Micrarchaeota archaeon]